MRKLLILLIGIAIFASCSPVRFDRYAGTAKSEIDSKYIGTYMNADISVNDSDTVMLYISSKSYTISDRSETSIEFLDEEHVFSTYKNTDFIFIKENGAWSGFVLKKKSEKLTLIPIVAPSKRDTLKDAKVLNKYFDNVKVLSTKSSIDKYSYSASMDEKMLLKYINKIKKHKVVFTQVK